MAENYSVDSAVVINGVTYRRQESASDDGVIAKSPSVGAAKAGVLTTRTDNNTGTLTMDDAGHGITTGARLDLYWTGGKRRGITVGTVSGTSVPIDLGDGDNLPVATTAVKAAVPASEEFLFTGTNASAAAAKLEGAAGATGQVVFAQADNTEVKYAPVTSGGSGDYNWDENGGASNPLTGVSVGKVFFSHDDTAAARVMRAAATFS